MPRQNRIPKKPRSPFPKKETTKKSGSSQESSSTSENAKIIETLVESLDSAKKNIPRGDQSKAIQSAKQLLENVASPELSTEALSDQDVSMDDSEPEYNANVSQIYSSKTWEKILSLRYEKKWSLKSILKNYKKLKTTEAARVYISRKKSQMKSMRKSLSREEFKKLDEVVWKLIDDMDKRYETIHDSTIREIATREALKMGKLFKASKCWVNAFKKRHHLASRHVDCFVSQKKIESEIELKTTVERFKKKEWGEIRKKCRECQLYNFDQTALKLEAVGNRTITVRGRRKVFRKIQRNSARTHSITLHIGVTADGKLFKKTFVVLNERKLPKKFEKIRAQFKHLVIRNTPSGMMNSKLAIEWMEKIFAPSARKNSTLVLDSWPGFKQMKAVPIVARKNFDIRTLPAGSTPYLQPLDLFFNRQLKSFNKRVADKIRAQHSRFVIAKRENMLKLVNLMMNQFSAKVFKPMVKLGWYQAGFIQTHPPHFITPADYCFYYPEDDFICLHDNCARDTFLKCAHCKLAKCFRHALDHIH